MILVTDNRAPRAGLRGRTAPRHCAGEGRGGAGRARSAPLLNSLPLEWRDKGEREEGRGVGLGQEEAQWRVGGGWLRRSRLSRASRPGEPSATTRAHMARSLLRASAGGLARAGGRAGAGGLVGGRRKLRVRAQCGRGPRVRAHRWRRTRGRGPGGSPCRTSSRGGSRARACASVTPVQMRSGNAGDQARSVGWARLGNRTGQDPATER